MYCIFISKQVYLQRQHQQYKVQQSYVIRIWLLTFLVILINSMPRVHAQDAAFVNGEATLRRQAQKEQALQAERAQQAVNVHMEVNAENASIGSMPIPTNETPCFVINRIVLKTYSAQATTNETTSLVSVKNSENFNWALRGVRYKNDGVIGKCIGKQGISIVMQRIQNNLIEKGFITTRIIAEPQDLNQNSLTLLVIPGRLRHIVLNDTAKGQFSPFMSLPSREQKLINLRDIEQGLENLQRIPTATADIQIVPVEGEAGVHGDSDLLVSFEQKRRVRLSFSTDDTGSMETGKYQGGATLSIDNPFKLNDLFYITGNHDLGGGDKEIKHRGTRGYALHYSIPFGYTTLSLNSNAFRYYQMIPGEDADYKYKGTSKTHEIGLSHILHRDQTSKTSVSIGGWWRSSRNFIEDTEVEVQRRRMAGFTLGLSHQRQIKNLSLEASITYKRGTGAFKALPAPEEEFGEGTSRFRLIRANVSWQYPFTIKDYSLRYMGSLDAQWNPSRIVPLDFFSIGGRYSVRGFDGEMTLSGERGMTLRNELGLALGKSGQEIYLAVDAGRVSGPSTEFLEGKVLVGSALGLRGHFKGLNYDAFVGVALKKPRHFKTKQPSFGFSLSYQF